MSIRITDVTPAVLARDYVAATRTVNGHALSADVTLSAADVGAVALASITVNPDDGSLEWVTP